jgi:hypothetical protein
MGPGIKAVKNATLVDDPRLSEIDDLIMVYHGDFPKQCGDLKDQSYYKHDEEEWFCSMSYGRYNYFRNELAKIGGWPEVKTEKPTLDDPDYEEKSFLHRNPNIAGVYKGDDNARNWPFIEVIVFSDCEGFICTDVCKKLHQDFVTHQAKADELLKEKPDWLEMYNGMKNAFKFGSSEGFVQFT